MQYVVDLAYEPDPDLDPLHLDERIEKVAGQERASSGFGFGLRDMQFNYDTGLEADRVAKRLAAQFSGRLAHLSVYEEPTSDEYIMLLALEAMAGRDEDPFPNGGE